ncbi:hypothetical protein IGI04_041593 [Brassica rapa subsp. trilocularis]|uniref:GHMP kinase C-terminal domain-containing protein n=1 Tax=Brassica rapa subsp. trilocularis TaxID=1813537 RepID=A0ABQ7KRS9_BRACM|nr:hypothetical protein IGI04_041593 [Brassica rapa subsp. trilocularis]
MKSQLFRSIALRAILLSLQDRVAQVYGGGLVHMDFSKDHMDRVGYEIYTIMDINLLTPLHLIYAENSSDSGKVHSTVRRKWLDGDEFIISSMAEIEKLAEDGRTALLKIDYTKELMNRNFDLRRSMFGDACLGAMNIEMVEVARKVGAAAKFTGSGGCFLPRWAISDQTSRRRISRDLRLRKHNLVVLDPEISV